MKNLQRKYSAANSVKLSDRGIFSIVAMIALCVIMYSCQVKNAISPTTSKSNPKQIKSSVSFTGQTIEQKRAYLESILMETGKYIVSAAQADPDSRNIIYQELEKQVDGDENAIIDLFYKKIGALSGSRDFLNSLNAFDDLDSNRYFPQIFINNYSDLKSAGKIGTENPILAVFYTGDDSQSSINAYRLNADNKWEFVKTVDENAANNEEIWVFGLNETFENQIDLGILPLDTVPVNLPQKPTGPVSEYCDNGDHYWPYIQTMQISDRKESWLGGKSDIWMKTYTGWDTPNSVNPCDASQPHIYWINYANGQVFIRKYSKKEVNHQTNVTVNFGYAGTWRPGIYNPAGWEGDAFNYVIFEKDQWPTSLKISEIDNNGFTGSYQYRSAQSPYDKGIILFWGAPGTHMNGYVGYVPSEIWFNSRL